MTPERWKQVEEVFQSALDMEAGDERARFVAQACSGDDDLRAQVEALIGQYEEAGDFIEEPALAGRPGYTDPNATNPISFAAYVDPALGRRIGAYRLVREIGRGGMGAVYLAERADSEFRRRVAVKLIKRGMDTDFILRRFRNERQILATLDHSYIARLLDGGTTEDGLPYFVMEYIEGLPVYRYCDENKLTINERLRLFRKVCDAVHYAHRQQVIHRDIKPSNILVTPDGVPKLLDFGIAKLLNPEFAGEITLDPTATAMRLMTPEYASPEQVQGQPVTPATDVYSLGVLLYELLTGHRPYRLRQRAPHEVARVICEEEPPAPSSRITSPEDLLPAHPASGDPATLHYLYWSRNSTLDSLRSELEGDLDRVVMKALRKDPSDRYKTAEELRDDITRRLEGRPVLAPPAASATPRRAESAPAPAPAVDDRSLAILPLRVVDSRRDGDTGDEYLGVGLADALITRLSSLRRFALRPTSSVLRYQGPDADPVRAGRELGVAYVLEGRIRRWGGRIRVTIQLLDVRTGSAAWAGQFDEKYTDVLQLEDAISAQVAEALVPHLTGGERERLRKRGTESADAYEAYLRGRFHWNTFTEDGFARAIVCYHQAIAFDPSYAVAYAGIAEYFNWLGIYGVMPFRECSAAAKEAAAKAVELDPALAEAHAALGLAALTNDFDWSGGESRLLRSIDLNPNLAAAHLWYSLQLTMERRFDEALAEGRKAEELDPLAVITRYNLAWFYYQARRYEEGVALCRRVIEAEPNSGMIFYAMSFMLSRRGEHDEAISAARRSVELNGEAGHALARLGCAFASAGRAAEAEETLRRMDEAAAHRYVSPYQRALVYSCLGRRERTLDLLEEAHALGDAWLAWMGVEPQLDPVRNHPRFAELLRLTNNPTTIRALDSTPPGVAGQKSVAVLPLRVVGHAPAGSTGDDYLGVGLADALITRLSNVRRFLVRPTSSVLRYDGDGDRDPFDAGRELGVEYVIDGHVQRAGERIRVSVQVLDVRRRTTVWAEAFNEPFTDVLGVQDAISTRAADALVPHLTGEERRQLQKRGTDNPEAFEAYLRGRYHLYLVTPDNIERAVGYFERAAAIDPSYALAYAGLAECYFCLTAFASTSPAESCPALRRMAERAIELDDTLGDAYAMLAFVTHFYDLDFAQAERLMTRGLQLNPNNAVGRTCYSALLVARGEFDRAVEESRRGVALDPLSPFVQQHLGWTLYQARRLDEALAQGRKVVETDPDFAHGLATYAWALRHAGRFDEALRHARRAVELMNGAPWVVAFLAAVCAAAGRVDEARSLLRRLADTEASGAFVSHYCLALVRLQLGERDRALELLEEALAAREVWLIWLTSEPTLDPLRADPRYRDLVRRASTPAAAGLAESGQAARRLSAGEKSAGGAAGVERAVAVLPLKVLGAPSEDTGDEYLGIGLADALITRLSNVRRLTVRPTSAVLRLGDAAEDTPEAGRRLGVDFVVSGTVRRAVGRIRVTAQLTNVADGATRWAEQFDEDYTDVLQLEDVISGRIVEAIVPQLTGEERRQLKKRATDSPEAFEEYLRGRYHWNTFTEESFAKALACYRRAIAVDPDYALAYAGIADYYNLLGVLAVTPYAETSAAAKEAARKSVALDESSAEGYAALGFAVFTHDFDWAEAERLLRRALELNPKGITGRVWLCLLLGLSGRFDEAVDEARRTVELDPLTPLVQQALNWTLYQARRFDEALAAGRSFARSEPRYGPAHIFLCVTLLQAGEYDEAVEEGRRAVELLGRSPYALSWLAAAYAAGGHRDEAAALLDEMRRGSPARYASPYLVAMVYANLGETERAIKELERALSIRDAKLAWLAVDPQFDSLRNHPRFDELLRRTNNPLAALPAPALTGERSVAVLPLKGIGPAGGGAGEDYLGLGLADALVTRLSNVRRFVVRPTNSVMRFRGVDADPVRAGRELGVDFVVSGTIRRAGDRVRVIAQLTGVADGATRWGARFDEKFDDVLRLEDSISERVADALVPHLTGEERERLRKRGTESADAYEAYLRGRFHWNTFTEDGFARAIECYNRAVEIDPSYALAHAAIADYYNFAGVFCMMPFAEAAAAAKKAALRAVAIDSAIAEAYSALGLASASGYDWAGAEEAHLRAVELSPNLASAHQWYSLFLSMSGRADEAVSEMQRARELDPLSSLVMHSVAWAYHYARRYEEALTTYRNLTNAVPDNPWVNATYSQTLLQAGRYEEAVNVSRWAVELTGGGPLYLPYFGTALAAAGRGDEARRVLRQLEEMSRTRHVSPYLTALVHARLGEHDRALGLLERAYEIKDGWLDWAAVEPEFTPLRGHPRFNAVLRRAGHPAAPEPAEGPVTTGERSVAVLPLRLLGASSAESSDDTGEAYLAVGLADALVTRLSNVRRLLVRPVSSVLRFRGDADPLAVGRELGVDYVVSGTIRRVGGRVRVTVQLLSVGDATARWAERFEEEFTNMLRLEDSISRQVAEAVVPRLTGEERERLSKRGTDNPEAFEAYLRGRFHWNMFTEDGFAKALIWYNRAIAIDPSYALAYAGIADYYNWLGVYAVLPFAETSAAAKEAARKSVSLNPALAEAYCALGFATVTHDFDWRGGEEHLRRAVELNPNYATGRLWYAYFLGLSGRPDEALAHVARALELDPITPIGYQARAWVLFYARRFDESERAARELVEREPQYGLGQVSLCLVLLNNGHYEEAFEAGERGAALLGRSPYTLAWLAAAYAAAGRRENAQALLDEMRQMSSTRHVSPYLLAMVHCKLGETERALAELERALKERDGRLAWLGVDPLFDALRPSPRFEEILRRTSNPAAGRADKGRTTSARAAQPTSPPRARAVEAAQANNGIDAEARQLYVAGRYYATRRTAEGLRQAIERFERAVVRAPRFALAYAEMADCYALLNWYVEPPPAGAWERAKESALRAVEADDTLAEAHASLGYVLLHHERDFRAAEGEFRRAIDLKPDNAVARRWHSFNLAAMGRHDEAVEEIRGARELSPDSPVMATAVANVLFLARRFDEAVEACGRALELDPGSVAAHVVMRWAYEHKGLREEALSVYEQESVFAGDTPTTRAKRAHVLAATGSGDEARAILEEIIARRADEWVTAYEIAVIYSILGDRDHALEWLTRASEERAVGYTFALVDPHLDNLRPDPRFKEMLGRTHAVGMEVQEDKEVKDGGRREAAPIAGGEKIAVLPCKVLNLEPGEGTGDAYLPLGLADALITRLSNIRSIAVRPTSAVARFAGQDVDPAEAGRALGVDFVLDGRLLKSGGRVRLTVQLVSVREGVPVWAAKFDEQYTDILDIQDSVSELVVESLVPHLTERERVRVAARATNNFAAYEAYLRGRYHWNTMSEGGFARAIDSFREAIRLDPDFALAYAGIADYYNWLGVHGVRPSAECFAEAKEAAHKAIALDAGLAEGYAALNFAEVGLWNFAEGERHIKRAVELNPNYATARNFYCLQLAAEGRFEEAEREALRGIEIDPQSPHLRQSLGWGLYHARRFEESLRSLDDSLELDPNFVLSRWVKGWTFSELGRHEEAVAELERAALLTDRASVPILAGLGVAYALAGRAGDARRVLEELRAMAVAGRHVSPYHPALLHAALGEDEKALDLLEEAQRMREAWLIWIKGEPKLDRLRDKPRFAELLRSVHPAGREGAS